MATCVILHVGSFVGFVIRPEAFYWRSWEWFEDFPYKSRQFAGRWARPEEGDISWFHLFLYKDAVDTSVTTDALGFRSTPLASRNYPVVVSGDSTIWGCGLSDEETLPYLLSEKLGLPVYNASRTDLPNALLHPDLQQVKVVVDGRTERKIEGYVFQWYGHVGSEFRPLAHGILDRWETFFEVSPERYSPVARLSKVPERLFTDLEALWNGADVPYLYVEHQHGPADLASAVQHIVARQRWLRQRGIRYLFLPIPAKQTLYKPDVDPYTLSYLRRLYRALRARRVEVVDLLTSFEVEKERGLFQKYDTHWNTHGVRLAAEVVAEYLESERR
jgi:hypothetical protein